MAAWLKDKKNNRNNKFSNNRINIILAIVFLLGFSVIYKLYVLQVLNNDLYSAQASGQHSITNKLEPERGKIYINEYEDGFDSPILYPLATNKNFAHVYSVPKDIKHPEEVAEKLFEVFKKESVQKEVEILLLNQEQQKKEEELNFIKDWPEEERLVKENEIIEKYENLDKNNEYQELRRMKKEEEIEARKEKIIQEYVEVLTKENDPYEPLEKKVDDKDLKKFYALLANLENEEIDENSLIIQGNKIFVGPEDGKQELEIDGIGFQMFNHRYYPEGSIGAHLVGFARRTEEGKRGSYGLEGFFDEELFGKFGHLKSESSADRNVIIVNDREYIKPVSGKGLVLTIDRSVQYTVCELFNDTAQKYAIDGGSVIVMDPATGQIIAMCSWPVFDPNNYEKEENIKVFNNPVVFDQYEPGSVFKTITMAAALDQEKVTPDTIYNDEGTIMIDGWPKPIKNSDYDTHGGHGEVNMNTVLELSLNTGAIFAMRQIGSEKFAEYVHNFGFGEKTGIELEAESAGNIRNLQTEKIHEIYSATASFGQGITVTPLQMISSYAVIANGGIMMKPYVVKEIIHEDGRHEIIQPVEVRRVISERAATLVSGMLVNVVDGGHAIRAAVKGYYVGGKTGTAQVASTLARGYSGKTIHTFVGYAPIDEPKFVMLVKLDNPKGVTYAAGSSAPLFGEIAEFLLNYWKIPKERK